MKKLLSIWFAVVVLAAGIPTIGMSQSSGRPGVGMMASVMPRPVESERVFFYTRSGDERATIALKDSLIERGAWHVNAFLPDFIGCELPPETNIADLLQNGDFTFLPERSIDMSSAASVVPGLDRIIESYERAERLWNTPSPDGGISAISRKGGFDDIVVTVPPEENQLPLEMTPGVGADDDIRLTNQNSEFLAGNILVISIYPESEGEAENWTDNQLADATMGVYSAMLNFQEQLGYVSMNFTFKTYRRSPTGYEPISYEMETDYLWINDVMMRIGYTPGHSQAVTAVHALNEYWRKDNGGNINWVFTALIANSQNIANHRFDNGAARYTAYANLGGPYLVMPFPAGENPYHIDDVLLFSQVFQHETCHIFWALDEYLEAQGVDCTSRSGYLNFVNMNKITGFDPIFGKPGGCQALVPCIMQSPKEDQGRPVCRYTRGQMGIVDVNNNSVPDVFDSAPDIEFENSEVETVFTSDVVVRAVVTSVPVPNNNPLFEDNPNKREYAAVLKDAWLSVDGAGHLYLLPEDGKWNEVEEVIVFNLSGIPTGLISIRITATSKAGISASYTKSLYNLGLSYSFFTVAVADARISLEWNMIGDTFGASFSLHRIGYASGRPDTITVQHDIQPSGPSQNGFLPYSVIDSTVHAGESYNYFVKGVYTIGTNIIREASSGLVPATAMVTIPEGNLLSSIVPNPFNPARDNMIFSIAVPESYLETGPDDGAAKEYSGPSRASALKELVRTPVDVVIYDVAGRRVKTIASKRIYSQAVTFQWDGKNENNDPVPAGIYFLKATAGPEQQVRKIVLMR